MFCLCYKLFTSMRNLLPATLVSSLIISLCAQVNAEIPKPPKFEDYAHLLRRSPFTIKVNKVVKAAVKPEKRVNYFLKGVTKLGDKWKATIVDRNEPKQHIFLRQGDLTKSGLKLVEVIQNKENFKLTKITIEANSESLTVGYRLDELLAKPAQPTKKSDRSREAINRNPDISGSSASASLLPPIDNNQGDLRDRGNQSSSSNQDKEDKPRTVRRPTRIRPKIRSNQ